MHLLDTSASFPLFLLLTILLTTTLTQAQTSISIITTEVIAATITITQAAPTTPLSASYTNALDLRTSILNSTNLYRYEHSAPFLFWNDSLAAYAQNWANRCQWSHSHGPNGENLAMGYADTTSSVDAWGDERALYSWSGSQTGFTETTGHFTQLVWKSTVSVGCAAVDCKGVKGSDVSGVFLVCEYYPPGNVVGEDNQFFIENVGRQANQGQGFDVASATNPATLTGIGATSLVGTATATATAGMGVGSPTGGKVGGDRMVRWLWGVGVMVMLGLFAGGMC